MTKFSDLKIGTKLVAGFSILALLVILIGGIGYNGIRKIADAGDLILNKQVPIADYSMELAINLITTHDLLGEYLSNEQGLDGIEKKFHEAFATFREVYAEKNKLKLNNKEKNMVKEFGVKIDEYETAAKEMLIAHKEAEERQRRALGE